MDGDHQEGLTALLDQFLAYTGLERGLAPATVKAYKSDLNMYIRWLSARGITSVEQIQTADVEGFLAHLADESSASRSRGWPLSMSGTGSPSSRGWPTRMSLVPSRLPRAPRPCRMCWTWTR